MSIQFSGAHTEEHPDRFFPWFTYQSSAKICLCFPWYPLNNKWKEVQPHPSFCSLVPAWFIQMRCKNGFNYTHTHTKRSDSLAHDPSVTWHSCSAKYLMLSCSPNNSSFFSSFQALLRILFSCPNSKAHSHVYGKETLSLGPHPTQQSNEWYFCLDSQLLRRRAFSLCSLEAALTDSSYK